MPSHERVSIALPFGSAIHAAIEMYYRSLKNNGNVEPLKALCERFQTFLELDLEHTDVPVLFKKDLPDHKARCGDGQCHAQSVSRDRRPNSPYHPGDCCRRASAGFTARDAFILGGAMGFAYEEGLNEQKRRKRKRFRDDAPN